MSKTIQEVVEQEKQSAKRAFVDACWNGESTEKLLDLSRAAGLEPEQADEIRGEIKRIGRILPTAAEVLKLRTKYQNARAHAEKVERKAQALEEKAERLRLEPQEVCEATFQAMSAAEDARRDVLALNMKRPDILPDARLPDAIQEIKRRKEAELKTSERKRAEHQHAERIRNTERRIEALTARLRTLPLSINKAAQSRQIEAEIELAKAELAKIRAEGPKVDAA